VRVIVQTDEATEVNWMWLPSWVGMNRALLERMQEELGEVLVGKTLDQANTCIVAWLQEQFPHIKGIDQYLAALEHVEIQDGKG